MERFAATPNTIKPMEGGIIGDDPARRDQSGRTSHVVSSGRIIGSRTAASAAVSAAADPGQRRHDDSREHRDISQSAMHMPNQRQCEIDDAFRQPACIHQFAGQQKERNGEQLKAVCAENHVLRDDLRIEDAEPPHQRHGTHNERERDRHARRTWHRTAKREKSRRSFEVALDVVGWIAAAIAGKFIQLEWR